MYHEKAIQEATSLRHTLPVCSRYRPDVAQMVDRGIALLFHDDGTRRG